MYAVVVSHPLTGDLSPAAVSYTSGFYHIPVIGISSRDAAFSDKVVFYTHYKLNLRKSFLEYSRVLFKNCATVLASGGRLGGNVETFQLQKSNFYTQF